jgi:inositol hexakisphosphate/diphosphoinositol-pentakisphosphate kinase
MVVNDPTTVELDRVVPSLSSSTIDAMATDAEDEHDGAPDKDMRTASNKSPPTTPIRTSPSATRHKSTPVDRCAGRVCLGICAMDKKARSKPMAEILSRLDEDLFDVVFFGDETILNQPIEEWPECDFLVAFFSKGFPLQKAKDYVALRRPFVLNDLDMQETLQDRRRVYDLLEALGIDTPKHVYLSRDGYVSTGTGDGNGANDQAVQEFDDHIEVNGVTVHKPFVEKPVSAEDHSIAIYYPTSTYFYQVAAVEMSLCRCYSLDSSRVAPLSDLTLLWLNSRTAGAGGGCKKLFRKVGNRSSEFYPDINEVRQDGSYIYEAFLETQGTDVKMYT